MPEMTEPAVAAAEYEAEPDYDLVYARIARTLERLCAECGFYNVLAVFSNDMPCHRRERDRQEKEAAAKIAAARALRKNHTKLQ